jgi:DNA-binding Xre family transcriptional regulator
MIGRRIRENSEYILASRKIPREHRRALKVLGRKLRKIILKQRGYSSLDAFANEYHDVIAKPTLYDLCEGRRDMRMSTFFGLCRALDVSPSELIRDIELASIN